MAKIKYLCSSDENWTIEVQIEVDFSILTEDRATEINAFWSSAKGRLEECADDAPSAAQAAAVKMAAAYMVSALMRSVYLPPEDLTRELYEEEGWGDHAWNGIRAIDVIGRSEIDFDNVRVVEIE